MLPKSYLYKILFSSHVPQDTIQTWNLIYFIFLTDNSINFTKLILVPQRFNPFQCDDLSCRVSIKPKLLISPILWRWQDELLIYIMKNERIIHALQRLNPFLFGHQGSFHTTYSTFRMSHNKYFILMSVFSMKFNVYIQVPQRINPLNPFSIKANDIF